MARTRASPGRFFSKIEVDLDQQTPPLWAFERLFGIHYPRFFPALLFPNWSNYSVSVSLCHSFTYEMCKQTYNAEVSCCVVIQRQSSSASLEARGLEKSRDNESQTNMCCASFKIFFSSKWFCLLVQIHFINSGEEQSRWSTHSRHREGADCWKSKTWYLSLCSACLINCSYRLPLLTDFVALVAASSGSRLK